MDRNKLLILIGLLVGIIIIAILLYSTSGKQDGEKITGEGATSNSSSGETEQYIDEELDGQVQKELVVSGNSEEGVEKIKEFIPDKDAEEIKKYIC